MKPLYGAIFVMSLAISTPLRADETEDDNYYPSPAMNQYDTAPYDTSPATNQSATPYYTPPATNRSVAPDYAPPAANQNAAPYYTPPATNQFYGPYYAPTQRYLPPPPPNYVPRPFKADPAFTLLDILIYRPVGLAATIAGAGLVVGLSPLIGLASIPRPHDAFPQAFDILVNAPAEYTFIRPLGERSLPFPYLPHY
ncbi:hypothetical protein [Methylomicrobium lacus]|uniref:hypothetical protein n=1 Tax=Methylomicrobium lacus TaxID=136992 RepID=UPI0004B5B294|nr:hypothetical protein [Methylomicrobium lacus]